MTCLVLVLRIGASQRRRRLGSFDRAAGGGSAASFGANHTGAARRCIRTCRTPELAAAPGDHAWKSRAGRPSRPGILPPSKDHSQGALAALASQTRWTRAPTLEQ